MQLSKLFPILVLGSIGTAEAATACSNTPPKAPAEAGTQAANGGNAGLAPGLMIDSDAAAADAGADAGSGSHYW
jgi:hypothetical protein